jgi:ABC-2 type transport system permease protein
MNIDYLGARPTLIAFWTLFIKEMKRFMRIWSQTLLPPAITMGLYFIIFGKFIGSQIQHIHGFTYMQYIVPGLVMMSLMTSAYANTSTSFFFCKFNKSIEEMLVSPMPSLIILLGFLTAGAFRGLMVGAIVLVVALGFTHLPVVHPFVVISMGVLASAVFSLGGLINGIYAKRFDDISFVPTFVLTPLTYLGGVFYSIDQLPPFWRSVSLFNPVLNIVDTFRFGVLGIADLNIAIGFSMILVCFFALFFWAWWCLKNGVGVKV